MKKLVPLLTIVIAVFAYSFPNPLAQEESSCVRCHTDEARIKSLYVPPKLEFKVEEGEG